MILSPFPYKVLNTGAIINGCVFDIPKFCLRNCNVAKCKGFYSSLKIDDGLKVCPYGFCAERIKIGEQDVVFTCLNIKEHSKRIEMRRHISDKDFNLPITINKYNQLKSVFYESLIGANNNLEELKEARDGAIINNEREALDNAIHEIRNLTNQLTSRADKLSDAVSGYIERDVVEPLSKNIYALSNLMSIRLESYNLEVDPSIITKTAKIEIPIYRKIEKAYKCLQERINGKRLHVNLIGNSYNKYNAGSLLEIAFFIILENAIKYSPVGETVNINFYENNDSLRVVFTNWGLKPNSDEIPRLKERGYRSRRVTDQNEIQGRGIGLYLLHQICEAYGIGINYGCKKESHAIDGYNYVPFFIELNFENMIEVDKDDE